MTNKALAPTAGLRGAGWDPQRMERRAYTVRPAGLRTADNQRTLGFLYRQSGQERTAVCLMHPREFSGTPYLVPDILDAGCAAWVQAPRSIGNDLRLEHELALLDVAAGVAHLRRLGFERVVLAGISGGAGLFGFYTQQALRTPVARVSTTPAGRPIKLAEADMPAPDGLVLISPHPGQGRLLLNCIDGSLISEDDPHSVDPALDPFDPANGYVDAPEPSNYSADFIQRYRAAQRARVERIDQRARGMLAARAQLRKQAKADDGQVLTPTMRRALAHTPIFFVWRTDADLRCWDTKLDPSDRQVGSLWGQNPFASNMGSVAFARQVTPESWLSTWSGLSSNASFEKFGAELTVPTLMLEYTGDQAAFPSDMDAIFNSLGSIDKERHRVRGNHHGQPLTAGEKSGQILVGQHLQHWLQRWNA